MVNKWLVHILGVCLSVMIALPALSASAPLPKRNLTVELRQIEEGDSSGYVVGTKARDALMVEQLVSVRNGEKATLVMSKAMPLQWLQSVSVQSAMLAASGASASSAGGGVNNAVVWMQAGQSITVQPRWPGGTQPASVEIDVQTANVSHRNGTELPDQSNSRLTTTVELPLCQWATIAISGSRPQPGVYSSQSSSNNRHLLQIRVLAH